MVQRHFPFTCFFPFFFLIRKRRFYYSSDYILLLFFFLLNLTAKPQNLSLQMSCVPLFLVWGRSIFPHHRFWHHPEQIQAFNSPTDTLTSQQFSFSPAEETTPFFYHSQGWSLLGLTSPAMSSIRNLLVLTLQHHFLPRSSYATTSFVLHFHSNSHVTKQSSPVLYVLHWLLADWPLIPFISLNTHFMADYLKHSLIKLSTSFILWTLPHVLDNIPARVSPITCIQESHS